MVDQPVKSNKVQDIIRYRFSDFCIYVTLELYFIDCIRSHCKNCPNTCENGSIKFSLYSSLLVFRLTKKSVHLNAIFLKCVIPFWTSINIANIVVVSQPNNRFLRFLCHFKDKTRSFKMVPKSQFWFWGTYCSVLYDESHIVFSDPNSSTFYREWNPVW